MLLPYQKLVKDAKCGRIRKEHICNLKHTKSSGSMESIGAVTMCWNMRIAQLRKNNLIYHEYLGYGDTSSFKDVTDFDPYKELDITAAKLECIRHVQKRLGTRLRNLVKSHKGTKTPIHGRGKVTDSLINSMQNYYGLAIRGNTDNLYAMKKAVLCYFIAHLSQMMPNAIVCAPGMKILGASFSWIN